MRPACVFLALLCLGSTQAWFWAAPAPAPPPPPDYKVQVLVSWDWYAGTDADVYIKLHGKTRTHQQWLDSSANDFERGSNREYRFNCGGDVGALSSIEIGHTSGDWWDGPDWKVDKVSVYDPHRKVWFYWNCYCWLDGYAASRRYYLPIHGGWSNWYAWSRCPSWCNNVRQKQTRYRYCTNPSPQRGGNNCYGSGSMTQWCPYKPCPVNGYWKPWGSYGKCSKTCGWGSKSRTRVCVPPRNGGKACVGSSTMTEKCKVKECPVNGYWKPWGPWAACSVTCGVGKKTRSRTCVAPLYGGSPCSGSSLETADCTMTPCPINGGWNAWQKKGSCSKECGGGLQTFSRSCNNPVPQYGGEDCDGSDEKKEACNTHHCPIDGRWTDWKEATKCDVQCGGGHLRKERFCTDPAPAYGGKPCVGDSVMTAECNSHPCPIDGGWTQWEIDQDCDKPCGGGHLHKARSCTKPAPQYGGSDCVGAASLTEECNTHQCPIDGGWTDWTFVTSCSKECGGGVRQMQRSCTEPSPAFGGAKCEGPEQKTEDCNTHHCPINGGWGDWQASGECTASCGGGTQNMVRMCDRPTPAHGGTTCEGDGEKTEPCNTQDCEPVDGGWSDWTTQGECTHSCGRGRQLFVRTCTNPAPMYGGKDCGSSARKVAICNSHPCPVDGGWTDYQPEGDCSASCGGGLQMMRRECNKPEPQYGGQQCEGEEKMQVACNSDPCPIDGGWSDWYDSVPCTATCGSRAMRRQQRDCNNPEPVYGGEPCQGSKFKNLRCDVPQCPVDGGWGDWSSVTSCSVTCGGGILRQTRECNNPPPAHGGRDCEGQASKVATCNTQSCHVQPTTTVAPVCGPDTQAGPHTMACLRDLWLGVGCAPSGDHYPREEKVGLLKWWNTQTVRALRYDYTAYRNKADGNDEKYLKLCYGTFEGCSALSEPGPHSLDCMRSIWKFVGCTEEGSHYPGEGNPNVEYWNSKTGLEMLQDMRDFYQNGIHGIKDQDKMCGVPRN